MTAVAPARPATPANLFGQDRDGLRAAFAAMGEPAYRADQVMHWIYRRGRDGFAGMTNLGKDLRARLADHFVIRPPELVTEQVSADGTRKWVLKVDAHGSASAAGAGRAGAADAHGSASAAGAGRAGAADAQGSASAAGAGADGGQAIETVYIPEAGRATLCISSQVGCAMDCSFCSTGKQGFSRNMTTAEIVAQVWFAARALGGDFQSERVISNIVFMGMGEPLANYGAVLPALKILLDDFGFGMSKRRVTVSTSGLVPYIDRLREDCDTALAVSLHAPNDALRDELVPINRKYPIAELMDACRRYTAGKDRKMHIVYEYVMLEGVNDSPALARDLARLLGDMPAKVNLIPFNPFPKAGYRRSRPEAVKAFSDILRARHVLTTTRKTRGDDIDAACGQLVGKVQSRQKQRLGDIAVRAVRP